MKKQFMEVLWLLLWVLCLSAGMYATLTYLSETTVTIFCAIVTISFIMWKVFANSENK